MKTDIREWQARWIWYPGAREAVNFHFLARKVFRLERAVRDAVLHVCVYTDYCLWINGRYVARGPAPAEPTAPMYDSHEVGPFLVAGENAIALVCHNHGVGTHWHHKGPGGLIAQLEAGTSEGRVLAATDGTWRVRAAEAYSPNSPRVFWSAGFMETYDFGREAKGWRERGFRDADWQAAEVVGDRLLQPWRGLQPRDIALLREEFAPSTGIEKGRFAVPGVHAVSFRGILPSGQAGLVYAETRFVADRDRDVRMHVSCDDAFRLFHDGKAVMEQNYNEVFARTRVWRGLDEYEQVHYGMSGLHSAQECAARFRKGENRLTVVVDASEVGWGFLLALRDLATGRALDLPFQGGGDRGRVWTLAGPFPSTGMNDSLDRVRGSLDGLPEDGRRAEADAFDFGEVTDYGTLMSYEDRSGWKPAAESDAVALSEGECCVADLGAVRVGYPVLNVRAAGEAVLDIAYSNALPDDKRIRFYQGGALRCADRVRAAPGAQAWQPLHRRNGRYVHISCRKGCEVRLSGLGIAQVGYPVEDTAVFACSDPLLDRVWEVSRHTTKLLMQYGYQDCLRREQGTLNHQSFDYASRAAACCFGETRLARRALRQAISNQHDDGWFDSHGVSSPNSDDVTQCLSWSVFLRDYLLYSGDLEFAADVFGAMENNLRYFGKMTNRHGLIDGRNMHVYRRGQLIYIDDACSYREEAGYTQLNVRNAEIFGLNLLFFAALTAAGDVAEALGRADRAAHWRRRADRVRRSCNERFWDEAKGLYAEWIENGRLSERHHAIVQMYALYYDICEERLCRRLTDYVVHSLGLPEVTRLDYPFTTFNSYHYYLEVLFRNGLDRMAVDTMRKVYGRWVEAGGTAFGEWFHPVESIRDGRLAGEFEVHGYGTGGHIHFYENLLGVRPVAPGFAAVRLAPRPGDLQWARGTLATPRGPLRVEWEAEKGSLSFRAELPKGVEWRADPPKGFGKCEIIVNGQRK